MARTRYGLPLWLARVPTARRPVYPRYKGDSETDVVIVGGGLAGCLTAYLFRRAGARVIVLEADRVGQRSAASGGWIPEYPGVPFRELQGQHGLRAARQIWEASRRSALEAAALLRRLAIKCDLDRADALMVAADDVHAQVLAREYRARVDAGLDATWASARRIAADLRAEGLFAGIRTKSDSVCDPYRACIGLATAAVKAGAALYERSPVGKVRAGRKHVELKTGSGIVTARTVVMATADPGPGCGALRRHVRVADTYMVSTPPLANPLLRQLGPSDVVLRDLAQPAHTLRHTKDGRLLFQGAGQKPVPPRQRDKAIVQRTGQLMYELSRLYPAMSGTPPEYGWSARTVTAADGLLLAGPHRNFPRHLFAIGLGVTGLAGAYLAGRILVRYYQESADSRDELFGFGRVQPVRA
jgi:gamma-glutamylputrescine oxidase